MAFFEESEIEDLYTESKAEGDVWREDYQEYERLADNDLIEDLDENLPEVNDGSLAAALFKLPKRVVSRKLIGHAKAVDEDEAWITELANIIWEKKIVPNARSQASFPRKWKDAVRKSAIYGSQPLINLFVHRGNYTGSDFIVPQAQDVTLEAGKVSDEDSDVIFWDLYYSKKQLRDMLEQAESEQGSGNKFNTWDVPALRGILNSSAGTQGDDQRDSQQEPNQKVDKPVKKTGYHFYVAFQRGVKAPFYMKHRDTKKTVRKWENPDPTGDIPVHYLYCYQDFINPYGIGIVKLAGGTQNVLDYFRQADVLATQLGLRPPRMVAGDEDSVDIESMVYAQDAIWFTKGTQVERVEISDAIYEQIPNRTAMYKTSLNQMIPTGDTSIASGSGDPNYSRTPAGVKFQAANLSIDDEDVKDNLYTTYPQVARSMINTHFANMQGSDLLQLSDEERDILIKAGADFLVDKNGIPLNELDVIWDEVRARFDFEMDPEQDKAKDEESRLDGLLKVTDFIKDPATQGLVTSNKPIILGKKQLDVGELLSEVISLTTDNKRVLQDVTPDEMAASEEEATSQDDPGDDPSQSMSYKDAPEDIKRQMEQRAGYQPSQTISPVQQQLDQKAADTTIRAHESAARAVQQPTTGAQPKQSKDAPDELMQQFGGDEGAAGFIAAARQQGFNEEEIMDALRRQGAPNE
jgi:hypothetical protein